MTFAEKLDAIMSVAGISNAELSRVLEVDRSTVSRLRTGARGTPKLPAIARIADCLADGSVKKSRMGTLAELTGDPRLRHLSSKEQAKEILTVWLSTDKPPRQSYVDSFISKVQDYETREVGNYTPYGRLPESLADTSFAAYTGNAGKRQALSDVLDFAFSLDRPCTLRLFTDEDIGWLTEDEAFSTQLAAQLHRLTAYGCRFELIQPSSMQLDYAFRSIERWLPAYMTGAVAQFYYPFERDDLHRRTLVVLPGHMALLASSINRQPAGFVTVLTTDATMVSSCEHEYDLILERCRAAMTVRSYERPQEQFDCLADMASVDAAGIYKSSALSAATVPPQLIERIGAGDSSLAKKMSASFKKRAEARAHVLEHHVIVDIMYLRPFADVVAGKVPVLSTGLLPCGQIFYTPVEYAAHIERILWYLENHSNYQAVLIDDPMWNDIIIYAKEGARTLLIKESSPPAIFEITERSMSDSMWDYLRRVAMPHMTSGSRQETVTRLQAELNSLQAYLSLSGPRAN